MCISIILFALYCCLRAFTKIEIMKIYTSYFGKLKKLQEKDILPVSIAVMTPRWFHDRTYIELAPRRGMLALDEDEYRKEFTEVLRMNSPMKVYKDLEIMVRNDKKLAIALLCYESPEKFCHRHLVAEWFMEKLGIEVREFDYVPKIEAPVPEQLNLF